MRCALSSLVRKSVPFLAVASLLAGYACEDGSTALAPEISQVQVRLVDAPDPAIEMAEVWISRVYLMREDDDDDPDTSNRVDLYNDPENPLYYDLLTLQDGFSADLTGWMPVEAGVYHQLRMIVDSARVTLAEGYHFKDGSMVAPLKVPGGSSSGIKVFLDAPVDAEGGESTTITVDFDVEESFKIQGKNNPNGFNGVMFKPVLKEKDREESSTDG
jgi:hypothetical protein